MLFKRLAKIVDGQIWVTCMKVIQCPLAGLRIVFETINFKQIHSILMGNLPPPSKAVNFLGKKDCSPVFSIEVNIFQIFVIWKINQRQGNFTDIKKNFPVVIFSYTFKILKGELNAVVLFRNTQVIFLELR